jgi:hypothetical protein
MKLIIMMMFLFSMNTAPLAFAKGEDDPQNEKQEETGHTTPKAERLNADMLPCHEGECNKDAIGGQLTEDNCDIGPNPFDTTQCGRGKGKTRKDGEADTGAE